MVPVIKDQDSRAILAHPVLRKERRPAAGTRHSEECRARFEGLLRALGEASMARADERVNEHLARQ
eukprot:12812124-Alexandrium_andersonii.AAC.1